MIKMVISSFYNALIDYEDAIPTSTMLEIERIRNKGILFSICTNRTKEELLEYNRDFPFIDYIVSLNGSLVYDVINSKVISKKKLTSTNINKINNIFNGYKITYYTEDKIFKKYKEDLEVLKIEIEIKDEKEIEKLNKVNVGYSIFKYNNKMYLEITNSRVNMFTGIDQISLRNNIHLSEVLVIGANNSDKAMITNIPNNYVVESNSSLLKLSNKKTSDNNSKGVEKVLKTIK